MAENPLAPSQSTRQVMVVSDNSEFSNILDTGKFEHLWRVAQMFSKSELVPTHYQGKPENCFITCQMAIRLGVDPFMLMQKTYIVHGRPGMEATIAVALMNSSGLFENSIDYEVDDPSGKGPKDPGYRVRAWAVRKSTGKRIDGPWVDWATVRAEGWDKKSGSKWLTMPGLMFMYRAASWFGRLHCPERLMGMQTADELEDSEVRKFVQSEPVQQQVFIDSQTGESHAMPPVGETVVGGMASGGKRKVKTAPAKTPVKGNFSDDVADALVAFGIDTVEDLVKTAAVTSWADLQSKLLKAGCLPAQVDQAFNKADPSWITTIPAKDEPEPPANVAADPVDPPVDVTPATQADRSRMKLAIDKRLLDIGVSKITDQIRYAVVGSALDIVPGEVQAALRVASVDTVQSIQSAVAEMSNEELTSIISSI